MRVMSGMKVQKIEKIHILRGFHVIKLKKRFNVTLKRFFYKLICVVRQDRLVVCIET